MRAAWLAIVISLVVGPALSQDIIIPDKPRPRDFPERRDVPRPSVGMFATSVARMNDGSTWVMYGYIFGTPRRDGYLMLANPKVGLRCIGKTARAGDRSGKGQVTCSGGGAFDGTSPIDIAPGVYGRAKGTTTGPVLDTRGRRVGTSITRWNGWDFPDPQALIATFN